MSNNFQTKVKTSVGAVGKLILSWQADVNEMKYLLISLQQLEGNWKSIKYSLSSENTNIDIIRVRNTFRDLQERLAYRIAADRETLLKQIRLVRIRLGDLNAAFRQKYTECMAIVTDETVQVCLPESAIFTVEHILDIQHIIKFSCCEYTRKETLLRSLFTLYEAKTDADISQARSNPLCDQLTELCSQWPDETATTFILHKDIVDRFILENNIQ